MKPDARLPIYQTKVSTIPSYHSAAALTLANRLRKKVDVVNDELVEYCGEPLEAMKQWGTNGSVHTDDLPSVGQVFTGDHARRLIRF